MASSCTSPRSSQEELEDELKDAGNRLLTPLSSVDELLALLDKVESLLSKVSQAPPKSMQDALLPSMKAVIANELLRHSDVNVRVSVLSCIIEVTRITAPDAPYNDEQMKDIFKLTVKAFDELSHGSGLSYSKAVQILETVAMVRSCLLMLDLECDALIVEMFHRFLDTIRSDHPPAVFPNMEKVMTLVIEESEEISLELLRPLLASVRKEHQDVSPFSFKLGENVLKNCAGTLKHYLPEAVKSTSLAFDDYAEIVALICQDAPGRELMVAKEGEPENTAQMKNDEILEDKKSLKALEHYQNMGQNNSNSRNDFQLKNSDASKAMPPESDFAAVTKKRGRKPNSLIKPEEGYDHSWINGRKKSLERPYDRKNHEKKFDGTHKNLASKESTLRSEPEKETSPRVLSTKTTHCRSRSASLPPNYSIPDGRHSTRGRRRKTESMLNQDGSLDLLSVPDENLLRSQHKEKASESDVTLKKESGGMKGLKAKPQRKSRKNLLVPMTNVEPTPSLKKGKGTSSDPEVKQESLLAKVGGQNQSEGTPMFEKHFTEESVDKKKVSPSAVKSLDKDESCLDKSSNTKIKRKWTPRKEKNLIPRVIKDYGEELVGCRIKVWWPLDQMFYEGAISSFDPSRKKHKVLYADGDEEILNLSKERWELLAEVLPDQASDLPASEQEAGLPSPSKSVKHQKKKAKTGSKSSIKQEKTVPSSRSSGISADKSVVIALKSGVTSVDSELNTLSCVDKLKNTSCSLLGDGQKSAGKPMTQPAKTITKVKFKTSQSLTKSRGENTRDESESNSVTEKH